jgi:molybdopterin-biosynthesis enzyme MoeA-like protein
VVKSFILRFRTHAADIDCLYAQWTKGVPLEIAPMANSAIVSYLREQFPSVKANLRMVCTMNFAFPSP